MRSDLTVYPSSGTKDGAIYLDNAATSWPKPPGVAEAMMRFMADSAANPGRSGHRMSIEAARVVFEAREAIAELFNATDPLRVLFGANITEALNLALHGLLKAGDHVVTTGMEHNSVMRPLNALSSRGISYTKVWCSENGEIDPQDVEHALRENTRLIVVNHASNVCGTIQPIREIGEIARRHGLLFLVDSAQTAGVLPIDMQADQIDLLAFTGHKSLYGPMGTGGLVVGDRLERGRLQPLKQGGTGSRSEQEWQPEFFPDCCESGTPNAVGLAGLLAAIQWIRTEGLKNIQTHEQELTRKLLSGLKRIRGLKVYGPQDPIKQTATVAINLGGMEPSEVGLRLDEEYGILSRVGLHCAPSAHQTLGTFPQGCVRLSLGFFNTSEDIDLTLEALEKLAKEAR